MNLSWLDKYATHPDRDSVSQALRDWREVFETYFDMPAKSRGLFLALLEAGDVVALRSFLREGVL